MRQSRRERTATRPARGGQSRHCEQRPADHAGALRVIAWFHCFNGIAGDMALGALLDAGADVAEVRALLERLPLGGWTLDAEAAQRCGIGATRAVVGAPEDGHHARPYRVVRSIVTEAALPPRVEGRALATFARLAEVEGKIHGVPAEDVHFHEVGALDAIVDVVGTCAALEVLGVDDVRASAVALGHGTVRGSHGILPNPAPAVVALLVGVPVVGVDIRMELTTPTGAALLAALATAFGALPVMTVRAVGYGAGMRDLDGRPNVTQVVLGDPVVAALEPGQPVLALDANVDDVTGEVLAHTVDALLAAGAHDAWVTPIVMKKGRPAHTISALCDPALGAQIAAVLAAETGTLGVRATRVDRWPRSRSQGTVTVDGHAVRIKVGPGRAKAEHDDAAAAARLLGVPLREVSARAEAAWAAEAGAVVPVAQAQATDDDKDKM
jgi:pyridinium-3,5-bisthiocarboxylic acid mononucleotide nickel chelatase